MSAFDRFAESYLRRMGVKIIYRLPHLKDSAEIIGDFLYDGKILFHKSLGYAIEIHKQDKEKIIIYRDPIKSYPPLTLLLWLKLLENDLTLIHGAGLAFSGKAVIFPAFPNVGKTSLAISLIKNGSNDWKLLGDDYLILSKKGVVYSYLRPFAIYSYHIPLLREYFSKARAKALRLMLASLLRRKLPRSVFKRFAHIGITEPLWLEVDKILPEKKTLKKASLFRIYMLSKSTSSLMEIKRASKETAALRMFNVLLYDLVTPYSHIFYVLSALGLIDLFTLLEKHKSIIDHALSHADVFHIFIPSVNLNFIELVKLIEKHIRQSSVMTTNSREEQ